MQIQSCFLSPGCTSGSGRSESEPALGVILLHQHREVTPVPQGAWDTQPGHRDFQQALILPTAHPINAADPGWWGVGGKAQPWDTAAALSLLTACLLSPSLLRGEVNF